MATTPKYEAQIQQVDLFQKGYDQYGQNHLQFTGSQKNLKSQTYYEAGVPSNFIQDGDVLRRLNLIDGWLQSNGFISGEKGWRIDSDGNVEFESGKFRGDITGASGAFSGDISAATGTFENALYVGDSKVVIDGENGAFKIKDGSDNTIIYLGL